MIKTFYVHSLANSFYERLPQIDFGCPPRMHVFNSFVGVIFLLIFFAEISPDAKAIISGPPDLHFKAGSAIILNCLVQQPSVKDIGPIYWYRGEHMITPFDADDGQPVVLVSRKDQPQRIPEDASLNDLMSEVDLQKEFATRIAMESQLGDTLKSRWVFHRPQSPN